MRFLAALASAAPILLSACATAIPAAIPPADPAAGRVIDITMREFAFSPSTITVTRGEVITFRLKNAGIVEHEFMAGRGAATGGGYAVDWIAKAVQGTVPAHTHPGEVHVGEGVRVSSDWILTLKVVVPPERGEYEFGCFVSGHYEAGMKGKLIVN